MGLFDWEPVLCDICGKNIKDAGYGKKKVTIKDGIICSDCWMKGHPENSHIRSENVSIQEINSRLEELEAKKAVYNAQTYDLKLSNFSINTKERKWIYPRLWLRENGGAFSTRPYTIYSFDDIEDVWSDSGTISYRKSEGKKKNSLGRAIIGGIAAGSTGAIVGAATANYHETANVVTTHHHYLYMKLSQYHEVIRLEVNSPRNADRLIDIFTADPAAQQQAPATSDPAEELRKYKALADEGVITAEDYEAKKKQLLGL